MPRSKEVDAWFAKYENPMKDVVLRMRSIILGADSRISECIKWQAPTFTFMGNLASFFPKSKQHASLMFHQGSKIPGDHPRLEGSGDTARVIKIASLAEADAAKKDLERVVRSWCDWRASEGSGKKEPAAREGATARKPVRSSGSTKKRAVRSS